MSKYAGHTPGPWTQNGFSSPIADDIGIVARASGRGGQMVAMVVTDEDAPQDDDALIANARLITAAPKLLRQRDALLEAAKKCKLYLERYTKLCPEEVALCELCRAAIAACEADETK